MRVCLKANGSRYIQHDRLVIVVATVVVVVPVAIVVEVARRSVLVGVVLVRSLVACIVLIVHIFGRLAGMAMSLFAVVGIHAW